MVSQARSQRLLYAHIAAGANSPAFGCPDGYTTLVKSVIVQNVDTTELIAYLIFQESGGASAAALLQVSVPTTGTLYTETWFAIHPGDVVYMFFQQGDGAVYVSGAVLAGPPLFPPAELIVPQNIPPLAQTLAALT